MNEKLKVTYLTLNPPNSGSIIATLGIHIPKIDLYLSKMRLVRKKNGGLYLAYPAEEFINQRSGNKEFQNFYWFGKKMSDYFQTQGFRAIQEFCQLKGIQDPTNGQPYEVRAGY